MRFRLRTPLIVLALGPPVLAWIWFGWPQSSGAAVAIAVWLVFAVLWATFHWCVAKR